VRFLAACDGVRSVLAAIERATVTELQHPFRWLTPDRRRSVLEASDALRVSRRGYAGQMRRGPNLTGFMVEVPRTDTIEELPVASASSTRRATGAFT
jgi:hypothetical protein